MWKNCKRQQQIGGFGMSWQTAYVPTGGEQTEGHCSHVHMYGGGRCSIAEVNVGLTFHYYFTMFVCVMKKRVGSLSKCQLILCLTYFSDCKGQVCYNSVLQNSHRVFANRYLYNCSSCLCLCSLMGTNPDIIMDSIVTMTQHMTSSQRNEVARILANLNAQEEVQSES